MVPEFNAMHVIQAGHGDAFTMSRSHVDNLHAIGKRVPLDVKRLACFLCAEIGGCRLEVIVVGLPHHRRPCRMTHPDEQSLSVVVGALVHRPITVVVQPLGVRCELTSILRFAKGTGDELIERSPSLRALLREVVLTPIFTLWPEMLWAERTRETFISHDVGHPSFGVQLACLPLVVFLRRNSPIRAMTAHAVVGR